MKIVNLYGEDGIAVYVDRYGDPTDFPPEAVKKIIGHACYPGLTLEQAHAAIVRAEPEFAAEVDAELKLDRKWREERKGVIA